MGEMKKYRFGNLVVNLAGSAVEKVCVTNTFQLCHFLTNKVTPNCCYLPTNYCLFGSCGYLSPCPHHSIIPECPGVSRFDIDIDRLTPVINELIPQITEQELLEHLKVDLEKAVAMVKEQEVVIKAATTPQTLAEVKEVEANLDKALAEVRTLKAKMEKGK